MEIETPAVQLLGYTSIPPAARKEATAFPAGCGCNLRPLDDRHVLKPSLLQIEGARTTLQPPS